MKYICVTCKRELEVNQKLNSRQRRAVTVCVDCVRAGLNLQELEELLHPDE